mmetsp:Transcript_57120/g.85072  ORF Transcript_57120/g.85072 Transcript_57120/m.85072 type:complete len:198 (+) Transcript_57120:104-697(+)
MNQHENQEQRQQLNKQTPSLPPHYVHIDPQSDSSIPQRRYSKKMEPHSNSNGANVIVAIPTDANLSSLKQRRQHSRSENNIIYYEQQRQLMHQIDEQERKLYNEAELYDLRHKSHHHHHHHPSHIHVTLPKKGASRALWIPRGFYWFFPLAVAQWYFLLKKNRLVILIIFEVQTRKDQSASNPAYWNVWSKNTFFTI